MLPKRTWLDCEMENSIPQDYLQNQGHNVSGVFSAGQTLENILPGAFLLDSSRVSDCWNLAVEKGSVNGGNDHFWRLPFSSLSHPIISYWLKKSVSHSVMSDSLWPRRLWLIKLLCLWNYTGRNTASDSHFLLQRIFPIQGSNPGLLHCRQTFYHLNHHGRPRSFAENPVLSYPETGKEHLCASFSRDSPTGLLTHSMRLKSQFISSTPTSGMSIIRHWWGQGKTFSRDVWTSDNPHIRLPGLYLCLSWPWWEFNLCYQITSYSHISTSSRRLPRGSSEHWDYHHSPHEFSDKVMNWWIQLRKEKSVSE